MKEFTGNFRALDFTEFNYDGFFITEFFFDDYCFCGESYDFNGVIPS